MIIMMFLLKSERTASNEKVLLPLFSPQIAVFSSKTQNKKMDFNFTIC
jgi:hypothetical protein